jgi:hypothetical protein
MRYSIVLFAAAVFVLFTAGGALAADPVYRFYNTEAGGHFYTTHEGERDSVIFDLPFFLYEGEAFEVSKTEAEGMVPVYRFHHPERGHYYTTSEDEKQHIQASFPKFTYEGEAFYAWDEQMDGVLPVYRFYKVETRTQFLTISQAEHDWLVENHANVYIDEGIAFYAAPGKGAPPAMRNISGPWNGEWHSDFNVGSTLVANINHNGTSLADSLTGTVDLYDSVCGDVTGAQLRGRYFDPDIYTPDSALLDATVSFTCNGSPATLDMFNGEYMWQPNESSIVSGEYELFVEGAFIDSGTFQMQEGTWTGPEERDLSGNYSGSWGSYATGHIDDAAASVTQDGNDLSGRIDLDGTDCGNLRNIPFMGSVNGDEVSFEASFSCQGLSARMEVEDAVIVGNGAELVIVGLYVFTVNGTPYDIGEFLLEKN